MGVFVRYGMLVLLGVTGGLYKAFCVHEMESVRLYGKALSGL